MSKTIRRICLFSGPGAGKSTLAARIFAEMKMLHYQVEHVTEYIKMWSYQNRFPVSFDQCYVFGHQLHREDDMLKHVQLVVTDSPMLLNVGYAKYYNCPFWESLLAITKLFESTFPSLNFFLPRRTDFKAEGRYQGLEESIKIDSYMKNMMVQHLDQSHCHYDISDFDKIMSIIRGTCNG